LARVLLPEPESPVNQRMALRCPRLSALAARSTEASCQTMLVALGVDAVITKGKKAVILTQMNAVP
jgi:hypothetical protein